jgi:hydrogenase maturation protein HypF
LPVLLHEPVPEIVAVGAHQKNTIAASVGEQVFISQHIGDLENLTAYNAFEQVLADFAELYELHPAVLACDQHRITSRLNSLTSE